MYATHFERETPAQPVPHEPAPSSTTPAGVRSPTVVALHSAGWLLLLCLFLPVSRGCNGSVVRPVDGLRITAPVHVADVIGCATLLGVYGYGLLIACFVTVSARLRSRAFWWRSFVGQAIVSACFGVYVLGCTLADAGTLKERLQASFACVPPVVLGLIWVGRALRQHQAEQAWARLQHLWSIAAWLQLNLLCLFSGTLLYGYWVTLLALAGQIFAVELARHRMHHDLWDRAHPPQRPQFSLSSMFLWITLLPLIFAYYQTIGPVIEWFFPEK